MAPAPAPTSPTQVVQPQPQPPAVLPTQAPDPKGGGGGGGGGADGKSPTAGPQNVRAAPSAELGPGTGFVNIDRYLQANQGIGGDVSKLGGKSLAQSSGMFTSALSQATAGANNGVAKAPDANAIGSLVSGVVPQSGGGSSHETIFGADPNALQSVTNALSGRYTGPTSINYDPTTDEGMRTAKGLANNATTGRVLAQQAGITGQYTPQLSAIDAALYGQVPDAVKATQGVASGLDANAQARVTGAAQFANLIKDKQQEAQSVADATRTQLLAAAHGILDPAEQAAAAANAQDQDNFTNDPNSKLYQAMRDAGVLTNREWVPGGTATASNFIDNQQASGLSTIAQLLNDPSLAIGAGQPYQAGHWLVDDPKQVGDLNVTTSTESRPGDSSETRAAIAQQARREAERARNPSLRYQSDRIRKLSKGNT